MLRVAGLSFAAAGAGALAPLAGRAAEPSSTRYKKAVKIGMVAGNQPLVEKFKLVKSLGYDGIELDSPNGFQRDEILRARDEADLPIHGVVDSVHWRDTLSHPDPEVRARGLEGLRTAIRDSKAYGGSTVLLVPAVVNTEVSYDQAYERSQAEIRKALPLAEDLDIKICFENVWNQFLLSPLETARYIDEFHSPYVGAYFDVGNVVNYGWPEQWVRILGKRIVKLDIKEFSRQRRDAEGLWKGFDVELGEGDCNWPAVMAALREIGYEGWGTAEVPGGDAERLRDVAARMDRCFAS
ncbi:MAG: sugar phosphate isomerase/epimerase [Pirellulales bacterium]|nr:sugar phosphate isomerase/epimerase [Pirellulales bacterium]